MLEILESIHALGWIHCDVKPNNILFDNINYHALVTRKDLSKESIFLIDYGLSKKAVACEAHILDTQSNVGNIHFMSRNQLLNEGPVSPKDDLESLIYAIVYLYTGDLPWGVSDTEQNHEQIRLKKLSTSTTRLGKDLPNKLKIAIEYIFSLNPKTSPDYQYLTSLLKGHDLPSQTNCSVIVSHSDNSKVFDKIPPSVHTLSPLRNCTFNQNFSNVLQSDINSPSESQVLQYELYEEADFHGVDILKNQTIKFNEEINMDASVYPQHFSFCQQEEDQNSDQECDDFNENLGMDEFEMPSSIPKDMNLKLIIS